jgi:tight adherence protein C
MEILVYGSVFLTSMGVLYVIYEQFLEPKALVKERLDNVKVIIDTREALSDEMHEPFTQRVINPAYEKIVTNLGKVAPSSIRDKYNALLVSAGLLGKMKYYNILAIQLLLASLLVLLNFVISRRLGNPIIANFMFLAVLIGFLFPYSVLKSKSEERRQRIQQALPNFLDLLHVTVEAGLSFDMSIYRTISKLKGPLSDELLFTMNEMNKGRERSEAFRDLVKRTQVEDLATFVTSIIQAEELGSNIGNVLRIQAETIRTAKRQRLETQAAKIPVKMIIPMTLCLLPAMLIVAVGPSIISIMNNFLK